jgi:hypothetical protein
MRALKLSQDQNFWSDTYCGRTIAIFKHHDQWLVYLDHLQLNKAFATPEDAVVWLMMRVDYHGSSRYQVAA